jgi:hypothetical protein
MRRLVADEPAFGFAARGVGRASRLGAGEDQRFTSSTQSASFIAVPLAGSLAALSLFALSRAAMSSLSAIPSLAVGANLQAARGERQFMRGRDGLTTEPLDRGGAQSAPSDNAVALAAHGERRASGSFPRARRIVKGTRMASPPTPACRGNAMKPTVSRALQGQPPSAPSARAPLPSRSPPAARTQGAATAQPGRGPSRHELGPAVPPIGAACAAGRATGAPLPPDARHNPSRRPTDPTTPTG